MPDRAATTGYDAAVGFLHGRIDFERMLSMPYGRGDLRLDRMRDLAARLGNPQDRLRIVHVAGTKGKGSTAAMAAAVLSAAGYRTGLYTSPHLERLEERLAVDGFPCPPEELVELVRRVRPVVEAMDATSAGGSHGPTYFEILTALALMHFVDHGVEAAVLEVGLGGRLDSTNICRPAVSVITSISYDHTQQLGSTLAEIAGEKAGIIKPGVPAVSGVLAAEPRAVIERVAHEQGARLAQLGRHFRYQYRPAEHLEQAGRPATLEFQYLGPQSPHGYADLSLGLVGEHQAANAAVALAALAELLPLGFDIPARAVRRGLAEVRWPARVEVLGRRPTIVVDGAHNVASVEAFVATLDRSFTASRRTLVFATTRDKDAHGMLQVLLPRFDQTILTRYTNNPRGMPPDELAATATAVGTGRWQVAADSVAAWRLARGRATPDSLIGITGSLFIAAEMRPLIRADRTATG